MKIQVFGIAPAFIIADFPRLLYSTRLVIAANIFWFIFWIAFLTALLVMKIRLFLVLL